jgi:hypothetical protein
MVRRIDTLERMIEVPAARRGLLDERMRGAVNQRLAKETSKKERS